MNISIYRQPLIANDPHHPFTPRISPELREAAKSVYAEDSDKFKRLMVWSPGGEVRLITGYCVSCEAKRGKEFTPIDLTEYDEGGSDEPTPKRTRK